jgi:hypothetical protein
MPNHLKNRASVNRHFHNFTNKSLQTLQRVINEYMLDLIEMWRPRNNKACIQTFVIFSVYVVCLKALCNEFFDGEIFELRYSVLCTGSKDANRFPKLQVALFL